MQYAWYGPGSSDGSGGSGSGSGIRIRFRLFSIPEIHKWIQNLSL